MLGGKNEVVFVLGIIRSLAFTSEYLPSRVVHAMMIPRSPLPLAGNFGAVTEFLCC